MGRFRFASAIAANQAHRLSFLLAVGIVDGLAVVLAASASDSPVVAGIIAAVASTLIVLFLLFGWAYLTSPRRLLEYRVDQLEETVESQRRQLATWVDEKWGDSEQFIPVYHDLRNDLREAKGRVQRARETGQLWSFRKQLEVGTWKRHREQLRTHPWATVDDVYGPLAAAFKRIDDLNTDSSVRWGRQRRRVKASDELDEAHAVIQAAEHKLTEVIEEAEAD
ncbi:MAG: hypothetical protein M3355_11960 [Actinomycetota bacterium]|nr:hypothetical protein [Actinomycetota bacterium]